MTYDKHDELMKELKEIAKTLEEQVDALKVEVAELRLQRLIEEGHWL